MVALREQVAGDILSACGVVPELVQAGPGTNAREVTRRWRVLHLEAVGDRLVEELSAKLERPVSIDWNQIETPDSMHQRARTVDLLVDAGIPVAEARTVAGLST